MKELLINFDGMVSQQYIATFLVIQQYYIPIAFMAELPPEHYELVLKYMQTTNQQNFQQAVLALQTHDFSLQRAVQNKFNPTTPVRSSRSSNREADQRIIRRYVEYVQRKNNQWSIIDTVFGFVKALVLGLLGMLTRILPSTLRLKYFGTDFQRLYRGKLPSTYTSRSMPSLLKLTRNLNSKSVLVLISPLNSHPHILSFMGKADLQKTLSRNFWLTGHVLGHSQLSKINNIQAPLLIALRHNMFEQLVEVGRTNQFDKIDSALLSRWANQGRNLYKRDCNVLIKYRNFINRAFGYYYEQEEEEEVNLSEVQNVSQQIQQQNRLYKEMENQAQKEREEQQRREQEERRERRRLEELEAERQARRSSIPAEPTQGQLIRFSFRCPDGSTIMRNFTPNQKLDLLFQWVQLNDQIEFQDPKKRTFQIMYNYPPQPLSQRRDNLISEVFDSPQEKLVIREL